MNSTLLAALKPADLTLSDSLGGWTVGQHLAHMAGFRLGWLAGPSPAHAQAVTPAPEGQNVWLWQPRDPGDVQDASRSGDEAAVQAVQDAVSENRSFADPCQEDAYQSHPAHFLQHTIVHDSHHRGQIMALLRQGGRTPEDMDAMDSHWAIWRE